MTHRRLATYVLPLGFVIALGASLSGSGCGGDPCKEDRENWLQTYGEPNEGQFEATIDGNHWTLFRYVTYINDVNRYGKVYISRTLAGDQAGLDRFLARVKEQGIVVESFIEDWHIFVEKDDSCVWCYDRQFDEDNIYKAIDECRKHPDLRPPPPEDAGYEDGKETGPAVGKGGTGPGGSGGFAGSGGFGGAGGSGGTGSDCDKALSKCLGPSSSCPDINKCIAGCTDPDVALSCICGCYSSSLDCHDYPTLLKCLSNEHADLCPISYDGIASSPCYNDAGTTAKAWFECWMDRSNTALASCPTQ